MSKTAELRANRKAAREANRSRAGSHWPLAVGVIFLIAFGSFLRLWEFSANYSLNHDEACLALNIIQRPLSALARPLDYGQAAPLGFLAIEHIMARLFGTTEHSLRLFPLGCSLASLLLFWILVRQRINGWAQMLPLGFFAVSQNLGVMSAQVKQYSAEVLIAIVLLLVCEPLLRGTPTRRQVITSVIAGTVALWFSFSAALVLGGIGLACFLAFGWRDSLQRYVAVFACWAVSFSLVFWMASSSQTKGAMQIIWALNFMPWANPAQMLPWLWAGFKNLCDSATSVRLAPIAVVALAIGMLAGWKRRNSFSMALTLSIVLCLVASALKQYPFTNRFLFFLAPAVLLLIFETSASLGSVSPLFRKSLAVVAVMALAYASASAIKNRVLQGAGDDAREVLTEVRREWQPGDKIYLSGAGTPLFLYYQTSLAFGENDYLTGRDAKSTELNPAFVQLPVTDGRVWFLYFQETERGFDESVLQHFQRQGSRLRDLRHKYYRATLWKLGSFKAK